LTESFGDVAGQREFDDFAERRSRPRTGEYAHSVVVPKNDKWVYIDP
jgi:hypothetical protein